MLATSDPNLLIGSLAIGGLVLAALWKVVAWVRDAPVRPEPWDVEVEHQLQTAQEICPHCSTPQPPTAWFCEHCGRAVGPYNNLMPYVNVFSEGEVLRNGTHDHLRKSPLIVLGYFLISFNFFVTAVINFHRAFIAGMLMMAGLVLFWRAIFRNFHRPDEESKIRQPETLELPK